MDAELRKGEPTIIRAFRLLYAVAPAVRQPLPCLHRSGSIIGGIYGDILIVMKEGEGGESRRSGTDCQRKNADFDKRGKGFASVGSLPGLRKWMRLAWTVEAGR